jgi:hypothetical protein
MPGLPTARPANASVRRADAEAKAGADNKHSRRFGTAKRISRVAASWPGPIWTLVVFWAAVFLRMTLTWRRPVTMRLSHRTGRRLGSVPGRTDDSRATLAANRSSRWRAFGPRCPSPFHGLVRLRTGSCGEPGARCRDGVDPRWRRSHPIEPPRRWLAARPGNARLSR